MRDIGKNIRDLRERAGLTQQQLADLLFVTRQTVSNYENGRSRPDVDTVIKIGEVLKADANAVLYGLPVPPERKRNVRRLCVTGGIAVLLLAVFVYMQWLMKKNDLHLYTFASLNVVLQVLVTPVAMFLLGYTVLGAMKLALGFRAPDWPWIRWASWGILGVSLLCLVSLIPISVFFSIVFVRGLVESSVSMSFPHIPIYSEFTHGLMWLNRYWSALWAIPGAVLALLHREKSAA